MTKIKKWLFTASLGASGLFFSTQLFAETFYCPNTARYVQTGSNQATVIIACGEPNAKEELEEANKIAEPAELWFYEVGFPNPLSLVVTFIRGRVTEIQLGGRRVESTDLCKIGDEANAIKIGDTSDLVSIACGNPNVVNKSTITEKLGTNKVVVWFYDFGTYRSKAKFKFVNGILTDIETQNSY